MENIRVFEIVLLTLSVLILIQGLVSAISLRKIPKSIHSISTRLVNLTRSIDQAQSTIIELIREKIDELNKRILSIHNRFPEEVSNLPVWVKNVKGEIIIVNQAMITQILTPLGLTPEKILGKTTTEIFDDKDFINQIEEIDKEVLRKGFGTANKVIINNKLPSFHMIKELIVFNNDIFYKAVFCPDL